MSSPSKEQFFVREMLPSQALELVEIVAATSATDPLALLIHPDLAKDPETGEATEEYKKRSQEDAEEYLEGMKKPDHVLRTVTCAVADNPEFEEHGTPSERDGTKSVANDEKVIAFAHWRYHKGRSEAEWKKLWETRKERRPEGSRHDFIDATRGQRELKKAEIVGSSDYYCLHGLYVLPVYQRRGIGSMLVEVGIQKADEMGWLSYIEATEMGDGLYRKFGFEEKDRVVVDLGDWGGEKGSMNTYTLLVRPAKKG